MVDGAVADTGRGTKTLEGIESMTVFGTDYDDTFTGGTGDDLFMGTSLGNDTFYGGAGVDSVWLEYGGSDSGISFNLGDGAIAATPSGKKTVYSVERVILFGSQFVDDITGGTGDDVISGGGGTDSIRGGEGNDSLSGGSDNDQLYGNAGSDSLFGGLGNDKLKGGTGSDSLAGSEGDDELSGGGGSDNLVGDGGNDNLNGGGGADLLEGGEGNDVLTGGTLNDRFVFENHLATGEDVMGDFNGGDLLLTTVALDDPDNDGRIEFGDKLTLSSGSTVEINNGSSDVNSLTFVGMVEANHQTYFAYGVTPSTAAATAAGAAAHFGQADYLF